MKRIITIFIITLAMFSFITLTGCNNENQNEEPNECNEHVDANNDKKCDVCGETIIEEPQPDKPKIPIENDESPLVVKSEGKTIYASPTGLMTNNGSYENPYDVATGFRRLTAGDTLILKDGTYRVGGRIRIEKPQSGNFASYISVKAENVNKAILDFSIMVFDGNNRGIQIDADYWYFYGIDIKGAGDNGMYIGGNYNKVEMCQFYENRDTGLQIGRSDGSFTNIKDWPHNNYIKNCTSFNNYDDETYGENADGFAAKLTVGEGNVFDGCIAYRNADDGWDTYAKSDSGNVGLTIIMNCVSFENGWTLTPHHENFRDNNSPMIYNTRDGDGIGFKLGGSSMEGSVLIENCIAYNNKLSGFSDNSNPGVISMRNCTAYNNSVVVKSDGSFGPSDGTSRNFDIARKNIAGTNSDSYNNYYGLLSYSTNMVDPNTVYSNGDTFKGSCGYSIFTKYSAATKNAKYYAFTTYTDANSYESDKAGTEYTKGLNDTIFASVKHNFITNDNNQLHYILRNSDNSINTHDMLRLVDPELLIYCEGKQIGANLNKTTWEEYEHFEFSTPELNKDTENSTRVLGAYDVLDVMCNPNAVFQNVKLLTQCNQCTVYWESSDENILKVGSEENKSLSSLTYTIGSITRDRKENKKVTLTATIYYEGAKMEKTFELNIMKDNPAIGIITGYENKYIIDQYDKWENPEVVVSNFTSLSGQLLEKDIDYNIEVTYKYATDKNAEFHKVSDIYTSVPGVYEVTYNVISKMNENDKVYASFFVYVSSSTAELDLNEKGKGISFHVAYDGVDISAELSSTSGFMYVYTSDSPIATAPTIKAEGKAYPVTDEIINITELNSNEEAYYIYVVFVNKANTFTSKVYNARIEIEEISTCKEFYDFVTNGTSSTKIYSLKNDLDFSNFNWEESMTTSTFGGLFNGNNHTISNLTINGTSAKNVNVFYKVSGGTIMNVKFHNVSLTGDQNVSTRVAVIGQLCDGTISNVALTNISASSWQSAAGLVGQVTGGTNYIKQVSLVNDETSSIVVSSKYCGGIVGNLQKDSSEEKVELYVEDCYVNATIGGDYDTGGYSGGIVGRYKNEFKTCVLSISRCVVYGKIMTDKNYAGGITGGCDNGLGKTKIENCVADIIMYYAGTWIDGNKAVSVKNGSPIMGRQTLGEGEFTYMQNYASFNDYNYGVSDGEDFGIKKYYKDFWRMSVKLDVENIWIYNEKTGTVTLKYID